MQRLQQLLEEHQGDTELCEILRKYDRIVKIIKQNSHIPKYDSDVDAESFRRIRKVVLHS